MESKDGGYNINLEVQLLGCDLSVWGFFSCSGGSNMQPKLKTTVLGVVQKGFEIPWERERRDGLNRPGSETPLLQLEPDHPHFHPIDVSGFCLRFPSKREPCCLQNKQV